MAGGRNLAVSPAVWRRLFADLGHPHIGLNYDHRISSGSKWTTWKPIREFADRIFHVHAKDCRVDGTSSTTRHTGLSLGLSHAQATGLGDVDWGQFFSAPTIRHGFHRRVCVRLRTGHTRVRSNGARTRFAKAPPISATTFPKARDELDLRRSGEDDRPFAARADADAG